MDLIKQKLYQDLLKDYEHTYETTYDMIDKKEYFDFVKEEIQKAIDTYDLSFQMGSKKKYSSKKGSGDSCKARLWNSHYEKRCSNQKKQGDLCERHHNILGEKGTLDFGYIDEERPTRNSNGDILIWYDNLDQIDEQIQLVMNTHSKKILDGIVHTLNKEN